MYDTNTAYDTFAAYDTRYQLYTSISTRVPLVRMYEHQNTDGTDNEQDGDRGTVS